MYALALYGLAVGTLGMVAVSNGDPVFYETIDSSHVVLVEGSSGSKGSGTGELGKQGSKSDKPTSGKQSFGADQPQSGDFSPNPAASTKTPGGTQRVEKDSGKSAGSDEQHGSGHQSDLKKK